MLEMLQSPPPDKILALSQTFRADERPGKLDLGVGVYKDEAGETVILRAVKEAERRIIADQRTKSYVAPTGNETFNTAMRDLIFGDAVPSERIAAVQAPGGSGALRMLCELVHRAERGAKVWLSDPTWANHQGILKQVGLEFTTYPYFDSDTKDVAYDAMRAALSHAGPGDVVMLHGCCHNPTGANLTLAQWEDLAGLAAELGFTPFIDIAYQGFGDGLTADAEGLRIMARAVPEMLVAASCSKNFALYRERVGCALVLCASAESAAITRANLGALARVNHSMPPDHGAAIVGMILTDPELRADWEAELEAMRLRMLTLREGLAEALRARTNSDRYDFIARHRGMFSRLGATPEMVTTLREEHAIYMIGDSRVNIAGLNAQTTDKLVEALVSVGL